MLSSTARLSSRRLAIRSVALNAQARCKSTGVPAAAVVTAKELAQQAPNREVAWTKSQRERVDIVDDPRFVQMELDGQPRPLAAIELIAEEPVRMVDGRLACCDGGDGALGHPRVWINLDEGKPESCGYCGLRFEMKPHHHH
ncbi:hypothetical protein GGI20_002724 [Coemansia sp. BCRC 34301]|nr:hypothetical protein GGI20_002724 [Coemansia sp. BCRC 34301]